MARVVCEPCINCKHTECVTVCPVDSFHEGPNMLVINPTSCIDCDACVSICPTQAIYPEDAVPEHWREFVELNARLSRLPSWKKLTQKKDPLGDLSDGNSRRELLVE